MKKRRRNLQVFKSSCVLTLSVVVVVITRERDFVENSQKKNTSLVMIVWDVYTRFTVIHIERRDREESVNQYSYSFQEDKTDSSMTEVEVFDSFSLELPTGELMREKRQHNSLCIWRSDGRTTQETESRETANLGWGLNCAKIMASLSSCKFLSSFAAKSTTETPFPFILTSFFFLVVDAVVRISLIPLITHFSSCRVEKRRQNLA